MVPSGMEAHLAVLMIGYSDPLTRRLASLAKGRLTLGAQFEQAEQNLVPLGFKRDLDIVDSEIETVNDMIATYCGD
jgi:hypothetical protein